MSKPILETLFDSGARVKILKFLFRNIGSNFSLKELATRTQERQSIINEEIKKLLEIGLVKIKR